MRTLLLAASCVALATSAALAAEQTLMVRGAPWVLTTNSPGGSCTLPRAGDPSGMYYECWDADGSRAVATRLGGCLETSGRGFCGPVEYRDKASAGMVFLCADGQAYLLSGDSSGTRCWLTGHDSVPGATCGSGLTYVTSSATAECDTGCTRSEGGGSCTIVPKKYEALKQAMLKTIIIPLDPKKDDPLLVPPKK